MTKSYLLDTNICIYISKNKPIQVLNHFKKLSIGQVCMSIITYGELYYGACKSQNPKAAILNLENLSQFIPYLPVDFTCSIQYGQVRSFLEKRGNVIGNNDMWIAAHAISLNKILVTNNIKEFERVPHLKLENWV